MNPQELQDPQSTIDGNQAAAALSFATMLSEQMMPTAPAGQEPMEEMSGEMPMEPMETMPEPVLESDEVPAEPAEEVVEEPTEPEESEESKKLDTLSKDLESFKGEVKGIIETKIGDLTKSIEDALK